MVLNWVSELLEFFQLKMDENIAVDMKVFVDVEKFATPKKICGFWHALHSVIFVLLRVSDVFFPYVYYIATERFTGLIT